MVPRFSPLSIPPHSIRFICPSPLPYLLLPSHSQHVDVAAMLIKHNSLVNATDRWSFTPLHEAAQKGRTQLCALLIVHGANVNTRNQEGELPYDLATVSPSLPFTAISHDIISIPRLTTLKHFYETPLPPSCQSRKCKPLSRPSPPLPALG